jgi:hypothetical protein
MKETGKLCALGRTRNFIGRKTYLVIAMILLLAQADSG